jgi:hypothetical protein
MRASQVQTFGQPMTVNEESFCRQKNNEKKFLLSFFVRYIKKRVPVMKVFVADLDGNLAMDLSNITEISC